MTEPIDLHDRRLEKLVARLSTALRGLSEEEQEEVLNTILRDLGSHVVVEVKRKEPKR